MQTTSGDSRRIHSKKPLRCAARMPLALKVTTDVRASRRATALETQFLDQRDHVVVMASWS
jgi:hypothetical protein